MDEDEDIMDEEEGPLDIHEILRTARVSLENSLRHVNTSLDMLRTFESESTVHDRFRFLSREIRHMPVIQRIERLAYPVVRTGPDGNILPETEEDRRNERDYYRRNIENFFKNNVHEDDILPSYKESDDDFDADFDDENDIPITLEDLVGPRKTSQDFQSEASQDELREIEDTVRKPKKRKGSFSRNASQDELSEVEDIRKSKKQKGSFSRNASQDELSEVEDIRKPRKQKGSFSRNASQDELSEIEDYSKKHGRRRNRHDIDLFKGKELNGKELKSGSETAKGKDVETAFGVQFEAQKESLFEKNIEKSQQENDSHTKSSLDESLSKQHLPKQKFDKKKLGKPSSTQDKHTKLGNKKSALKNVKDRKKSAVVMKNANAESSFERLLESKKVDNGNLQSVSVSKKVVNDEEGIQCDAVSHDVSEEGLTHFLQDFINQGIEKNVRLSIVVTDIMKDSAAKNDPEVYKFLKKNKSAENVVEEKDTNEQFIEDNQKSDESLNEISSKIENIPSHVENVPIDIQNIPIDVQDIPIDLENIPSDIENIPSDIENIPSDIENIPSVIENIPNEIENIPSQIENIPSEIENIPSEIENIPSDVENIPSQTKDDEVLNLENSPELFTDYESPSVSEERSLVEEDLENFNLFDAKVDFESIEDELPDQLKSKELTQDDEKEEYSEVEQDISDDEDYVDIDEADSNVGDTEVDLLKVLLSPITPEGGDEELFDENLFEDC